MRHFLKGLALAAILPLSACFDADVTADFTDTSEVKLDAVMTMGSEIYQMTQGMGEDPCEDGVGEVNADGSYTCSMLERRSLDALLAAMDEPDNDLGIGDGVTIAELDNGNITVSFDLSEMTSDLPPPEEREQVAAMFGDALVGHAMTITVIGKEIVSTNGEILNDGKAAQLVLPLETMFMPMADAIPESFDVELVPGR
ncbi:hypothetical protein [Maritimibacter sp. UBA3975]|uniref:hypothetical protein n=1 Tax=Maritimibacter sp. UBA3975 TaxID=1946833 RepID=UPI000C0A3CE3|nr:hypothetical protein [Maritimibacter sp. UBA3975]MAM63540.1 hypothetical protein [Maritimibacter sp.]|tara:strand:- start:66174 stop:66770 length:597 start_codon:yes stop_codon:yes gene_type:complete